MSWPVHNISGINMQATLAAASAGDANNLVKPHHPITCSGEGMAFHLADGTLECDHAITEPDDTRVKSCLHHTVAILLFEELHKQVSR